jgi:hypothetical protein
VGKLTFEMFHSVLLRSRDLSESLPMIPTSGEHAPEKRRSQRPPTSR